MRLPSEPEGNRFINPVPRYNLPIVDAQHWSLSAGNVPIPTDPLWRVTHERRVPMKTMTWLIAIFLALSNLKHLLPITP